MTRGSGPRLGIGILLGLALLACNGSHVLSSESRDAGHASADASEDASRPASGVASIAPEGGPTLGGDFGPDPPPQTCDVDAQRHTSQCSPPPPVCINERFSVTYQGGACISGACSWEKTDVDCTIFDGGVCIGGGTDDGGVVASADGRLMGTSDGCSVPLGEAPAPPVIACDPDAGADAATCPLPRSVCANSFTASWLLYFDDSACVSGRCQWQLKSVACEFGCYGGACGSRPTVPPPPPPPPPSPED